MKIQVMADGNILDGSPVEIVQGMQLLAFGQDDKSLEEYIQWAAGRTEQYLGVTMNVEGDDAESMASSFVQEMLDKGLAQKVTT